MWICEDCGYEGHPKWAQQEVERLQSFVEIPYCPKCGSFGIIDDPTSDYEIIVGGERSK